MNDSKERMMEACTLVSEMMVWLAKRDPAVGPKQAIEAMVVAIGITLRASNPSDKKQAKEGAKFVGKMVNDIIEMLDHVPNFHRKEDE